MSVTGLYPAFLEFAAPDVMTEGSQPGDTLDLGNLPGRDLNGTPLPIGWPFKRKVRVQEVSGGSPVDTIYDTAHLEGSAVWTDRDKGSGPKVRYKEGFFPNAGSRIRILFVMLAMVMASSVLAQGTRWPSNPPSRLRNISGATVKQGTIVELDTTSMLISLGHRFALPDTVTVDSFSTSPNRLGPFEVNIIARGTAAKDTLFIVGTAVPKRLVGVATPASRTEQVGANAADTLVVGDNISDLAWYTITQIRSRTTGFDSFTVRIKPLMAFQVADSLDTKVIGIVGPDSIPDDSVGTVFMSGVVPVAVYGASAITTGAMVSAGTSGHGILYTPYAPAAGDTLANGVQLRADFDQEIIGTAMMSTKGAVADTIPVFLHIRNKGPQ